EDRAGAALLAEEVDAVAGHAGDLVGEVDVAAADVVVPDALRRDALHHLDEVGLADDAVADRLDRPRGAEHGRAADGEVEVGGAVVVHEAEEAVDLLHRRRSVPSPRSAGRGWRAAPGE